MNEMQKEELAQLIAELIRTNPEVRSAVMRCACSAPGIVVEY